MNVVRFMFKWVAEGKLRSHFGNTDYKKRIRQLKILDKSSTKVHWGHIDLICCRNAPHHVWPYVLKWLRKRVAA